MAVALVMGNMIGSGIFLLPASLARFGGVSLIGWLVSAGGAICWPWSSRGWRGSTGGRRTVCLHAEGVRRPPGVPRRVGLLDLDLDRTGALAVAFVGYLTAFVPQLATARALAAAAAIAAVWLLVGVNVIGVRAAGWVQVVTTLLKLLPLALIGGRRPDGFRRLALHSRRYQLRALVDQRPGRGSADAVGVSRSRVRDDPRRQHPGPGRTIPRATLVGTALAAAIYIVSTIGVMSLLPAAALSSSTAPYADAARVAAGDWASRAVAAGAAISCFGALNGWILVAGQLPLAVARDGLFPRIFARTSQSGTPAAAMIIAGVLTTAMVCLNYTRGLVELFTFLILLATLNTLIPYAFSAMAVFVLPDRRAAHPFTAAAKAGAAIAFAYSLWAMAGAGAETIYWGFLLLMAGFPCTVIVRGSRIGRYVPED